jgi:hypothetical protein
VDGSTASDAARIDDIVPTPQGYSRALPIGHPGLNADVRSLTRWMRDKGFTGSVCNVSNAGVGIPG